VGQGLLVIESSGSNPDTPHSVGLLWTGDKTVAETSICQQTTVTRDRPPYSQGDSNPKSQKVSDPSLTP